MSNNGNPKPVQAQKLKKSEVRQIAEEIARILEPRIAALLACTTLDKEGAARYLHMSKSNLESRLREIRHSKPGKELVFHKRDLDAYLERTQCRNLETELNIVMEKMGIR